MSFRSWRGMHPAAALLFIACTAFYGSAGAQTCESPLPINSDPPSHVDTCSTGNSLPVLGGVIPSPHSDAVFSFRMVPGLSGNLWIDANFQATAFLMPSPCGQNTPLLDAGNTPTSIVLDGLSHGTYFLVISGDPDASTPVCGAAQITPNVTKTDVIFRNGFQTSS